MPPDEQSRDNGEGQHEGADCHRAEKREGIRGSDRAPDSEPQQIRTDRPVGALERIGCIKRFGHPAMLLDPEPQNADLLPLWDLSVAAKS